MSDEMKISIDDLSKKLQNMFPMPQILAKILKVINDPTASAASVEQTFKFEPSFTLKILTLANSAYYGCAGKITNIRAAITLLGFNLIKSIAIHASVNEFFNFTGSSLIFSGYDLWKHSVGVGLAAKMISRRLRLGNAEDFFTIGILHDIGLIIEYQFYREGFATVLTGLQEATKPICEIEKEVFGVDHAALTALLCEKWNMPQQMSTMVRYHHNPSGAPEALIPSATVLYLANYITKKNRYGFHYASLETITPAIMQCLGISEVDLEVLIEDFEQEVNDLSMTLD